MTKQVALANQTYDRLKRHKRPSESFSQTIERLLDVGPKDPWRFVRLHKGALSMEEEIQQVEDDRNMQWVDA